jgi:3-methyl-2-oxobutanoate hydroxymethyltransferase
VIGCGSGSGCDWQILIAPDILGLTEAEAPRFAKAYAELSGASIEAFRRYADEVKSGRYPDADHSYHMKKGEMDHLTRLLHP